MQASVDSGADHKGLSPEDLALRANLKTSLSLEVGFLAYLPKQGVSQQTPQWSLSITAGAARH